MTSNDIVQNSGICVAYLETRASTTQIMLLSLYYQDFKSHCLQCLDQSELQVDLGYVSRDVLKQLRGVEAKLVGVAKVNIDANSGLGFDKETGETGQKAVLILNRKAAIGAMKQFSDKNIPFKGNLLHGSRRSEVLLTTRETVKLCEAVGIHSS